MWKFLVKLVVTIALLGFAVNSVNRDEFSSALLQLNPIYLIITFVVQFLLSFIQALRWRIILSGLGTSITMMGAWKNVLLGLFFNQTLPSSIGGDAVRIYAARSIGLGLAVRSIIYDRLFALISLSAIGLFIISWFAHAGELLPYSRLMVCGQLAVFAGFIFLLFSHFFTSFQRVQNIPFIDKLNHFSACLMSVCSNKVNLFKIVSLSLFIHAIVSISGVLLFIGIGSKAPALALGGVFALVTLFSVIPVSIAGWGLRESLALALYSTIVPEGEIALAVSVYFGFVMMGVGGLGGIVYLVSGRSRGGLKA